MSRLPLPTRLKPLLYAEVSEYQRRAYGLHLQSVMDRVCEPPKTQEYFLMAMCNALHREWQKIITGHQQWMTLYPDFLFTLNDTKEWKLKDYHWYPFFLEKLTLLGVTDNKYFERGRIQYESLI